MTDRDIVERLRDQTGQEEIEQLKLSQSLRGIPTLNKLLARAERAEAVVEAARNELRWGHRAELKEALKSYDANAATAGSSRHQ